VTAFSKHTIIFDVLYNIVLVWKSFRRLCALINIFRYDFHPLPNLLILNLRKITLKTLTLVRKLFVDIISLSSKNH